MPVALVDVTYEQSKGMGGEGEGLEAITYLLNYTATKPNANIRYHKRGIILHIHCNGYYLTDPKSHSRVVVHFLLSDKTVDPSNSKRNGYIHVIEISKNVMRSSAEAEIGAT